LKHNNCSVDGRVIEALVFYKPVTKITKLGNDSPPALSGLVASSVLVGVSRSYTFSLYTSRKVRRTSRLLGFPSPLLAISAFTELLLEAQVRCLGLGREVLFRQQVGKNAL
jgi:hypothetical protein